MEHFFKAVLVLVFLLNSHVSLADECSFPSIDDAFRSSAVVVEAEKIYSGLSFHDFLKNFNQNQQADNYDLVSSWKKYKASQKQVEFLILHSLKGSHTRGDVISVENNIVLEKLYNIGNNFILFLQNTSSQLYYLDTCVQIDLSRRYANINFEEYTYLKFDDLVKRIEDKKGS